MLIFFQNEEDCKKLNFDHLSIFRPGLLGRGQDARMAEKFYGIVQRYIIEFTVIFTQ